MGGWALSTQTQQGISGAPAGHNSPQAETDLSWADAHSGNGVMFGLVPGYGAGLVGPWYEIDHGLVSISQTSLVTSNPDGFYHVEVQKSGTFTASEDPAYTLAENAPLGLELRRWFDTGIMAADANGVKWRMQTCFQPGDPPMLYSRCDMTNNLGSTNSFTTCDFDYVAGLTQANQPSSAAWIPANTGYGVVGGAQTTPIPTNPTTVATDADYAFVTATAASGLLLGVVGVRKESLTTIGASTAALSAFQNANRMKLNLQMSNGSLGANATASFHLLQVLRRNLATGSEPAAIAADYLNPDTAGSFTSVSSGSFTSFSYDEGHYLFASSSGNSLTFKHSLSGNVSARWNPAYKITGWSAANINLVSLNNLVLAEGTDYYQYVDRAGSNAYLKLLKQIVASGAGTGQLNNGVMVISGATTTPAGRASGA